jgi:hypothetical protein
MLHRGSAHGQPALSREPTSQVQRRRGGRATKDIGLWVRALGITDRQKAPNHAWRHRFKDLCRGVGIEKAVHDALTGHTSSDEGDKYGMGYPLATWAAAVARLPDQVMATA